MMNVCNDEMQRLMCLPDNELIFKNFRQIEKKSYFCSPLKKAFVAQLDRASHYG